MAPKFDPTEILSTRSTDDLSRKLTWLALEFSILGYLSEARSLISYYRAYDPVVPRQSNEQKYLWLAWNITSWPDGEEALVGGRIDQLAESYARDLWLLTLIDERDWAYTKAGMRKCMERMQEVKSDGGGSEDAATGHLSIVQGALLVKLLEIALVLEEEGSTEFCSERPPVIKAKTEEPDDSLPGIQQVLEWIAKRLHIDSMISQLAKSSRIWPVLIEGRLATVVGVKDEKVRDLTKEVLETFRKRFEGGRPKGELDNKPISELLAIISHDTISNEAVHRDWVLGFGIPEVKWPQSLLYDPLPTSEIEKLEERLNTTLPADYKEFLAASNGLDESWNGWYMDPPLFSAENVRWIKESETAYTELPVTLLASLEGLRSFHITDDELPTVGQTIEIGWKDIFTIWLLPPSKFREVKNAYLKKREESPETKTVIEGAIKEWAGSLDAFEALDWCVVAWTTGSGPHVETYPTFKEYLVEKAESASKDLEEKGEETYPLTRLLGSVL